VAFSVDDDVSYAERQSVFQQVKAYHQSSTFFCHSGLPLLLHTQEENFRTGKKIFAAVPLRLLPTAS
jgi:hypothetical protein